MGGAGWLQCLYYPESDVSFPLTVIVITHVAHKTNDLCDHRQKSLGRKSTAQKMTELKGGFVQLNVLGLYSSTLWYSI